MTEFTSFTYAPSDGLSRVYNRISVLALATSLSSRDVYLGFGTIDSTAIFDRIVQRIAAIINKAFSIFEKLFIPTKWSNKLPLELKLP